MNRTLPAILTLICCVLQSVARAEIRHVAVTGDDAGSGTASNPWRIIKHGADTLKPGDTLLIGQGLYRESVELKHGGTLRAPIVVAAQPGTHVIVSGADRLGGGWSRPAGAEIRGSGDVGDAEIEASVRPTWLTAAGPISYVHVRGLTFRYASNHAQRGAFSIGQGQGRESPSVSRGWLVEDCVFERTNGAGASFSGRGYLFRRCLFQDNGQLGFGTSRCHDTCMEERGIYRNNLEGYSTGWEAGGLKVTMSRNFVFSGCRAVDNRGVGIWFDIGKEAPEVKNCYIADNDEAGIFFEISFGLHAHDNLIVNNANNGESPGGSWGYGGITLSSSEDCVIEHNTYGAPWRSKSKQVSRIAEFTAASGIQDTSRVADPRFADVQAGDYRLLPGSTALAMKAGRREPAARP